jgi:hypothetical protein
VSSANEVRARQGQDKATDSDAPSPQQKGVITRLSNELELTDAQKKDLFEAAGGMPWTTGKASTLIELLKASKESDLPVDLSE